MQQGRRMSGLAKQSKQGRIFVLPVLHPANSYIYLLPVVRPARNLMHKRLLSKNKAGAAGDRDSLITQYSLDPYIVLQPVPV